MAQAPATPKAHRAKMLLLARLGLAKGQARADSESAALDLRRKLKRKHRQQVTFLIPLVGPHHVGDWQAVTQHLQATLNSFVMQDNPNWRAVICCQEQPHLPEDPRITWLRFDDPTPGNDKWRKLAALCDHLPQMDLQPGYVMSFDADDILRQGMVAEMLTRQEAGYLVEQGLVKDDSTGAIALAGRPTLGEPLRKPFWKLCGSCVAMPHDPELTQSTAFLKAMTAHEHRMFPYLAKLAGLPIRAFSKPAVLYVLNHGENFGARRGRVSFKTRFVERFRITDAQELADIEKDFAL